MFEQSEDADAPIAPLVLVVDDDPLIRMLACDILLDGGYDPLEAVCAEDAQALLDSRPDIALMFTDVEMKGAMDGLDLARLTSLKKPRLPIIVTSGAVAPRGNDLPPDARFLKKPYLPSALLGMVGEIVPRKERF